MKKAVFLSLIALFFIYGCTREKKSPIEGQWKLVYASYPEDNWAFPGNINYSGVKTWISGSFVFAGKFKSDTAKYNNYGWGKYKLTDGNKYEESIDYHNIESMSGTTVKMLLEVKNDTLVQKWPVTDNWQLADKYNTEKFVLCK